MFLYMNDEPHEKKEGKNIFWETWTLSASFHIFHLQHNVYLIYTKSKDGKLSYFMFHKSCGIYSMY